MAINLGGTTEVYRIIGRSSEEIAESDVEAYLNEADRKIKSRHFNTYMEDLVYATSVRATGQVNLSYDTYFPLKESSSLKVYVNGVLQTLSTHYSISGNTVTFTSASDIYSGARITFTYIPDFFDDYANYLAAERIYVTSLIDTSNAVSQGVYQNIKDTAREYEMMAASKPHVATYLDHREGRGIF